MGRLPLAILLLVCWSRNWYPAPLAAADEPVLASDDFAELNPAWGKADDVMSAGDGKLVLRPKAKGAYRVFYGKEPLGDIDVRAKVSLVKGGNDNGGGIIFWGSSDGFYIARFFADGYVGVSRNVKGKSLPAATDRVAPELAKGLGEVNALRVVTSGDRATVYVNDKQVIALKGFPPEGGGRVGFYGSSAAEPYEWAFSEFRVHKGPAPQETGPTDAGLLFADDFSEFDPAWGEADQIASASDNKLILTPDSLYTHTRLYSGSFFGDAEIRVDVSLSKGGTDKPAGILFWAADKDNYYSARLYADGNCGVVRIAQGKSEQVVELKPHPAVRKGAGQMNELCVVTKGDSATLYVNHLPVATFKGAPPEGGSRIGLQAASADERYTWTFANLSVRKEAAASPAKPDPAVLLTDEFSTLGADWGTPDKEFSVSDHRFIIAPSPNSTLVRHYLGKKFGDIDARVKLTQIVGDLIDSSSGLAFWGDSESAYMVRLFGDGTIGVGRLLHGKILVPAYDRKHDAIQQGLGAVNEVRVVTSGTLATVYVNDQELFTFQGRPPAGETRVGFYASPIGEKGIWAFSDFSVRKGPPAKQQLQQSDADVLYADDFKTLDPAWGPVDDAQRVEDGKLMMIPLASKTRTCLYRGDLFGDFDVRVTLSQTKGNPHKRAGIYFWGKGYADGYAFLLAADDGSLLIVPRIENKWTGGTTVKIADAAKVGLGQVNELRVVASGNTAKLYVNDKLISTYTGTPPKTGSLVGFYGESAEDRSTFEFSKFSVRKP